MHSLLPPNFQSSSVLVRYLYVEPSLSRLGHELLTQVPPALEAEYPIPLFASVSQISANKPPIYAFWKVNLATVLYNHVLSPRGAEPEILDYSP